MSDSTSGSIDGELTILLGNGLQLGGWDSVHVNRSIERAPSSFDISLTERYPDEDTQMAVQPGQRVTVAIGRDTVLMGWIDRVGLSFTPRGHTIRILGRSRLSDLVDCDVTSDMLNGSTVNSPDVVELAKQMCERFNIGVTLVGSPDLTLKSKSGLPLQFNVTTAETGWDVLERVARYKGLLIYDNEYGELVIGSVAAGAMASGFYQGLNVQGAAVTYSMDERYSVYIPQLMSMNFFGNLGQGGITYKSAYDQGPAAGTAAGEVTRYRPKVVISEQFDADNQSLAERRAQWEAARRYGRSQSVRITCDRWRDSSGALWTPNMTAEIKLPALKLAPRDSPWVIASVDYVRSLATGTVAQLVLMPQQAFNPQPDILLPFIYDPTTQASPASGAGPGGLLGHI